jgi:glycosyltransferase involved in cell wall biosynthesis
MKVLLLCNYLSDGQQSMLRFGDLLQRGLSGRGHEVAVMRPERRVQNLLRRMHGLGKWAGYVDKYLLFPRGLARKIRELEAPGSGLVHVVDHSNAVYVPRRRAVPWLATCHDLLAVRGALGEDTDCPASWLGRRLQRKIVRGLARADAVACDSTSTLADLERLVRPEGAQRRRVILLAPSHPYRPIDRAGALARLGREGAIPWSAPFLLHVGSNLRRKNKAAIVRVLARLRDTWPGNLVFCGAELAPELRTQAQAAGLAGRVFPLAHPDEDQLEAVYSLAHALVFPSKCEGFGWPIIEAQACGCPVICSDRTSLPEVGGEAAMVYGLEDETGMAQAVLQLDRPEWRAERVRRGFENLKRFQVDRLMGDYCQMYGDLLSSYPLPGPSLTSSLYP